MLGEGIFFMSRVEQLEGEVRTLTPDELKAFRDWFLRFDSDAWDQQIEADVRNGKLTSLIERAIREHDSGLSTPL
jgi:hypothetical protein